MKRKTKNIISFIIIIILLIAIGLTINYGSSNSKKLEGIKESETRGPNQENMQEPPEKPDKNGQSASEDNTPPELPSNENNQQNPPSKPDGENNMNNGNMPTQTTETKTNNSQSTAFYIITCLESLLLSLIIIYLFQSKFNKKNIKETYNSKDKIIIYILSTIIATAILTLGISYFTSKYLTNNGQNENQIQPSENGNMNNNNISYTSPNKIEESTSLLDKEYTSTTADENALLVSGNINVTADNITVNKTGDSTGGDNTSFYGINSGIIATGGAVLNLKNINVTTNATGANGVFAFGGNATTNNSTSDGTTINISDSTITTKKDNSGGIMTTGGGTTNASNLTIETAGTSSAAIRSDRGGGTVNVDGGTYKTTGQGSPAIYSTANISVKNAKLIATASEGIVIEGKNSVAIENTELIDTNNKLNGQSTTYKNIFLYQSMSGDAADGTSNFSAKNSTITTNNGDTFYITNTTATIALTNNKIVNYDSTGNFLRIKADSWGTTGSNGGIVTLTMYDQTATGNIVVDSISTLDMSMDSSSYTGTINGENTAKNIKLTLDKNSKIKLTGDSYISELDNSDLTNSNIDFNGYKLYVNGKSIN